MSDELIIEAQQHYSEMNGLNSRAAEVMMELVAALEAKTGVRVDMSSAVGVETQLATRVPVQGEPNDEREHAVLAKVIDTEAATYDPVTGAHRHEHHEPLTLAGGSDMAERIADKVLAAGFSRAAVLEAATEALLQTERRDVLRFEDMAVDAMAERDAALAAVERVKVILDRDDFGDDWEHDEWVYREAAEKKLGEIEAALDGAPEPEEKP